MKIYLTITIWFCLAAAAQSQTAIQTAAEPVFRKVDVMPMFPGCDSIGDAFERKKCADIRMLRFIYTNVKYAEKARKKKIEGTVIVSFIVEPDGSISSEVIVRGVGGGLDEATLDVIRLMREQNIRWNPGTQNGQPVRVQFNLPVRFKLK